MPIKRGEVHFVEERTTPERQYIKSICGLWCCATMNIEEEKNTVDYFDWLYASHTSIHLLDIMDKDKTVCPVCEERTRHLLTIMALDTGR